MPTMKRGDSSYVRMGINGSSATSPTVVNSGPPSAFGLGSGAFASFGASPRGTKGDQTSDQLGDSTEQLPSTAPISQLTSKPVSSNQDLFGIDHCHSLLHAWVIWYRPPTTKNTDYERSMIPLGTFASIEGFWDLYACLKPPSALPPISDYHLFRKGIRPIWEDEANRQGGKWAIRLRKGVSDRCWDRLVLTVLAERLTEMQEDVCGVVLSVRASEDVLSIWTRTDGGRNSNTRDAIRSHLKIPSDTYITFKSHDESMARRSTNDHSRPDGLPESSGMRRRDNPPRDIGLITQ